jgi:ornithine carbamoyltransferase
MKDLISIADLAPDDVRLLVESAVELKQGKGKPPLDGKTLALMFEKPSLRTRVSFDVAMKQLGGNSIYLSPAEVGMGTREPVEDTAKVLSRYVDGIVARTFAQRTVVMLAKHATVPVINGLSNEEHPCQILSDLLTIYEKKGQLEGLTLAYIGDANNVSNSLLIACAMVGIQFRIASPKGYSPKRQVLEKAREYLKDESKLVVTDDKKVAVDKADVVYTDVWISMGQEAEAAKRRSVFSKYRVGEKLLALAKEDVIFMHPLPAHHGEEITPDLLDAPQSVVFDQAENRLHMQKAILVKLLK